MYCLRFFRPLPKGRLCYNNNLIKRSIQWRNAENSPLSLKRNLFSKSSAVRLPKQKCVGGEPNLNENQLSQWKQQLVENASTLFDSTDKQSSDAEKRIAHLEHLVGRMAAALDIQKKLLTWNRTNLI